MTRNRKAKLAARALAAQTGTRYVHARRIESSRWQNVFSEMSEASRPRLHLVTEFASQSSETSDAPPVKLLAFEYAVDPVDSPERVASISRDQALVKMNSDDPRLESLLTDERNHVRKYTVDRYREVIAWERHIQEMLPGHVALVPPLVNDAEEQQVFGALDFSGFYVLHSEDTNKDIFTNPYLINEAQRLVDGEWVGAEDVVEWNGVAAREALIGSKIRSVPGLELCTRIGSASKLPSKWNDDCKVLVVTVTCDGIEPSEVCEKLDAVREALGVQSIGATPIDTVGEDIVVDKNGDPLLCSISKPKILSLFLSNRAVDDSSMAKAAMGMSRYVSSASVLAS